MPFKLPKFRSSKCDALIVCGSLVADPNATALKPTSQEGLVATYRDGRADRYLRVIVEPENEQHVYVDVSRTISPEGAPPTVVNSEQNKVEKYIDQLRGRSLRARLRGRFLLPEKELPEGSLIRLSRLLVGDSDLGIKMTGAAFEIQGTLRCWLVWRVIGAERLAIDIETHIETKIDDTFLARLFRLANDAFRAYVFGESPNDNQDNY